MSHLTNSVWADALMAEIDTRIRKMRRCLNAAAALSVMATIASLVAMTAFVSTSARQVAAKESDKRSPFMLEGVAKYEVFNFPTPAVAEILCASAAVSKDGREGLRWDRVMAAGKVRLPINRSLIVNLRFDGLEKLASLDCLKKCQVREFSAEALDFEDKHIPYLKAFQTLRPRLPKSEYVRICDQ